MSAVRLGFFIVSWLCCGGINLGDFYDRILKETASSLEQNEKTRKQILSIGNVRENQ
jgi:hypothetical protein